MKRHTKLPQYEKGFQDGSRVGKREAFYDGVIKGFRTYEVCFVYTMKDFFKMSDSETLAFMDAVHKYIGMVTDEYITLPAMEKALFDTFKYKFEWNDKVKQV